MKKSAIFNLYARRDQMKEALTKIEEDSARNAKFVELLDKASEEDKKKYEIDSFIDSVKEQNKSYEEQKEQMKEMIRNTEEIISLYESDKSKYESLLNTILISFGCKEAEVKEQFYAVERPLYMLLQFSGQNACLISAKSMVRIHLEAPFIYASVTQRLEFMPYKRAVLGSNPSGSTIFKGSKKYEN